MNIVKYTNSRSRIGEVASISGNLINVFLYPHSYQSVSMGDFLLIVGGVGGYVGVVVRNLHKVRRERNFSLMGMDYEEIKRLYPDIDRLYIYAIDLILVGYVTNDSKTIIGLSGSPRIHDPVYKMDDSDVKDIFIRLDGIDFSLFRYLRDYLEDVVWFREFLRRNRDVLTTLSNRRVLLDKYLDTLIWLGVSPRSMGRLLSVFIEEVFGVG